MKRKGERRVLSLNSCSLWFTIYLFRDSSQIHPLLVAEEGEESCDGDRISSFQTSYSIETDKGRKNGISNLPLAS
jgi:hypothetical protein